MLLEMLVADAVGTDVSNSLLEKRFENVPNAF